MSDTSVRVRWRPRLAWVGITWDAEGPGYFHVVGWMEWRYDLWVCLLPCLPIHITWYRSVQCDS